jgi:hypothetical protein
MNKEPVPDQQKQVSNVSAIERGISLLMAMAVLGTLIFLVIQPRSMDASTFAIVRFLAATFAGIAGYLFAGTIGLETTIPLNKTQVRSTGAFAAFVLVLFFFGFALPNSTSVSTPTTISSKADTKQDKSDLLGRVWTMEESGWYGTWKRQGNTNKFDATWTQPETGNQFNSEVTVSIYDDNRIMAKREDINFNGEQNGNYCTYSGSLFQETMEISGNVDCKGKYPNRLAWKAKIEK